MARNDAPFVVKRLAPMIGSPDGARRVSVEGRGYTLAQALEIAGAHVRRRLALERMVEADGSGRWRQDTIRWCQRCSTWIERRGQSAWRGRGAA